MKKPYYEALRITRDEDTNIERECPCMFLWCNVDSIQVGEEEVFTNRRAKTIVNLCSGATLWLVMPYAPVQAEWAAWLDAASNIQSVFTNN